MDRELLEEQQEYYRARAPEYDDWFLRRGRYDRGPEENQRWFTEVGELRKALQTFRPEGRVLEIAAGTGWWTEELLRYAREITALDASQEVLEMNRQRVRGDPRVEHVQADVFGWRPLRTYDLVFFGFWLSHVPKSGFVRFWDLVRAALEPGGRVFFIDSLRSAGPMTWSEIQTEQGDTVQVRRLLDGREYKVVKTLYDPIALERTLESMGWGITVAQTDAFFLYGYGCHQDDRAP